MKLFDKIYVFIYWCVSKRLSPERTTIWALNYLLFLMINSKPPKRLMIMLLRISHPKVLCNQNKVALQRSPVVYCLEETDNQDNYDNAVITSGMEFKPEYRQDFLDGVAIIRARNENNDYLFVP